jgi:PKD repeat protein
MTTVFAGDDFTIDNTGPADSGSPGYNGINGTGQSEYVGPQSNTTKYNVTTSSTSSLYISIGSDGTIYGAGGDKVYAFYANNGSVKWNYTLITGGAFYPTIGNNETIYVAANKYLYAFDYEGNLKWLPVEFNTTASSSALNYFKPILIGSDGTIYEMFLVSTTTTFLFAVSPNGETKWNLTISGASRTMVIGEDGYLYAGLSGTRGIVKINLVTREISNFTNSTTSHSFFAITIGNDWIIYGLIYYSNNSKGIMAFKNDGSEIWSAGIDDIDIGAVGALHIISLSDDGIIYYAPYAINASNGEILPEQYISNQRPTTTTTKSPDLIGADGNVYMVGANNISAFDRHGSILWTYGVTGAFNLVIGADGTLYFTAGGQLYAIKDFNANFDYVVDGTGIAFTGDSSFDDVTWYWDFDDGYTSTLQNPTHQYDLVGNYTVVLTVTSAYGEVATYSQVVEFLDVVPPTVSTSVGSGTYNAPQHVYLTISESGKIYYTVDGTDPSSSSTRMEYTDCVFVNSTTVLRYIAIDDAGNPSGGYLLNIVIDAGTVPPVDTVPPTVSTSAGSGTYFGDVKVTLTPSENGVIYYTVDGSDPSSSSSRKVYTGPITISSTTSLRYVAVDVAGNPSEPYLLYYNIQKDLTPGNPVQSTSSVYSKDLTVSLPTVAGSTLYYKVDDGAYQKYVGPFTLTKTSVVSHYYQDANGVKTQVKSAKYVIDKIAPKVLEKNTKKFKAVKAKKQTLKIKFSEKIKITKANLKKIVVKTTTGKKIKVSVSIKNNVLSVKIPKIAKKTKFTITIPKNIVKDYVDNVLKKKTTLKYVSK